MVRFLIASWLVVACVGAFAPLLAVAQEADEDVPLYLRPRFDRVVLKDGKHVDVQTLRFDGSRKVPSPLPSAGKLEIRPLVASTAAVKHSIDWSLIARIELFEDMIMAEAKRLVAAGEFDPAFGYFAYLLKTSPDTRGLDEAINDYLQADALAAFKAGEFDRALAILGSLYERNPAGMNLSRAVDTVADKIIDQYIKDRDYNAARLTLDVVGSNFEGLSLTVVDKWRGKFETAATQQLREAQRLAGERKYLAARAAVSQARAVWPQIEGANQLLARIQQEHPIVRVGVFEPAPPQPAARIDRWAATRVADLVAPSLVSLRGYSTEGGVYSSPAANITIDDTGLGMTIELAEGASDDSLVVGLGAAALARHLLEATDPNSATYDEVLASLVAEVQVQYPRTVVVTLSRPHVRPEALLEMAVPRDLAASAGVAIFDVVERTDTQVRYAASSAAAGRLAEIHEVTFADDSSAVAALLRGEVEVLDRVPVWQLKNLQSSSDIEVGAYQLPTIHALVPTGKSELASQREFRRALLFGMNRDQMFKRELGATGPGFEVVSGPFPKGASPSDPIRYGYNSQVRLRDYDPRLAILLASVAWVNVQKLQGIKEPSAPLPTLTLGHSRDPLARAACQSIATNLRPVVRLDVVEMSPEDMIDNPQKVDLLYVELSVWEPVTDARKLLGTGGIAADTSDFMSISLDRLDSATQWNDVRARLYQIHDVASTDLPLIPLWQTPVYYAHRKSVLGLKPQSVRLYQDIGDWQVDVVGERL